MPSSGEEKKRSRNCCRK